MDRRVKIAIFLVFFYGTTVHHTSNALKSTSPVKTSSKGNSSSTYTSWSPWSRCIDCIQRRLKSCISPKCHDSSIYEERPCKRKRCKRKTHHKLDFHIVQQGQDSSHLVRQAPSHVWAKWSPWTPCSANCRTKRTRNCRKPGRCRKKTQEQTAYCYYENSVCETHVVHMINSQQQQQQAGSTTTTTPRPPRRRKAPRCGVPFRRARMLKIIGGVESEQDKWPWHVAILNQYNEVFCGGTLISPRWVLTASHCVRQNLRVRVNEYDLQRDDGHEMEMVVRKIFQHPRFNQQTVDNDIALLQLPQAVHLPVACLPSRQPKPKEKCSVMGWGKLKSEHMYGTLVLHETELPVVSKSTCKRSYPHFLITPNMLCAGWVSGKSDTCAGDSGGGLMCPEKHKSHLAYSVQGITSFGDGCGLRNKFGIYTTVFNYMKWIYFIMNHYS